MADDPTNLTERLLRDIQATLSEHTSLLKEHGAGVRDMRREMHDWQETTATALGFAGYANVRIESCRSRSTN